MAKKKNVVVLGAAGRMGKTLVRCLIEERVPSLELGGAVDLWDASELGQDSGLMSGTSESGVPLGSDLNDVGPRADVIVDFSSPKCTAGNAERIAEWGSAWVIGTTGLNSEEMAAVEAAAKKVPVVMAGNMSLGINLLTMLVKQGAKSLREKGYDIEVTERHHRRKKDAPSGTAFMLGRAAAEGAGIDFEKAQCCGREGIVGERSDDEIGIHAVRGGDIVGDHSVLMAGSGELLELSHRATSRDVFSLGALRAADWVTGQEPGFYNMRSVLGLEDA